MGGCVKYFKPAFRTVEARLPPCARFALPLLPALPDCRAGSIGNGFRCFARMEKFPHDPYCNLGVTLGFRQHA